MELRSIFVPAQAVRIAAQPKVKRVAAVNTFFLCLLIDMLFSLFIAQSEPV
jgi:hypothetical protein